MPKTVSEAARELLHEIDQDEEDGITMSHEAWDCLDALRAALASSETVRVPRDEIRAAVANYMYSEGCSCCQADNHDEHARVLAELLDVPLYHDGSGYDFQSFRKDDPTDGR